MLSSRTGFSYASSLGGHREVVVLALENGHPPPGSPNTSLVFVIGAGRLRVRAGQLCGHESLRALVDDPVDEMCCLDICAGYCVCIDVERGRCTSVGKASEDDTYSDSQIRASGLP